MTEERRRYFRIDDSMGVSYRCIGSEEAKVFAEQTQANSGTFDFAANFDNRIQTLLDACKIQAPVAAELVDLINKKLNFVIAQMDVDSELMHKIAYSLKQVNVSACGMAFANEEKLDKGQLLQLDIMLHPSELHIAAMAKVVECMPLNIDEAEGDNTCFVRVDFAEVNSNDQELLIQHIVKRQSEILKQKRRMSE
ncbi:PilZ domain-containing protein [Oceanicoccus sagamiensis]|uniref:PilZ domain-containing protein n=1 Tax=Oceanicoccus sagamiensis TaxID=716816 RepID=A0A1X9NC38_9GAMM|nr:PilZ domain-containing protein [Oceanicoccus sagamiensis]ARN73465.1 PilZ domain-containing protein [Oceanicoccus sagamiensis]